MPELSRTQRAYLQAMGIQVWSQREGVVTECDDLSGDLAQDQALQVRTQVANALEKKVVTDTRAAVEANSAVKTSSAPSIDIVNQCSGFGWQDLQARVRVCTACDLHTTRTQTVFGVGNQQADWLVIGEAPGADEDRQGEPFVGRAGQLLNNMLLAIGLRREQVYIANILKCRPPNNRDPRPEEVAQCESFLMRQIQLLQPRIILAVGRIAAQNLLKTDLALSRLRGKVHFLDNARSGGLNIPVVITYHPAYLLRSPKEKRKAWQDLQFAVSTFKENV